MLDESEFLPYPASGHCPDTSGQSIYTHGRRRKFCIAYVPGESDSGMFGGNSNWRGPIWFPVNYLIIESLQRFHHYYGNDFTVEHPTGSGKYLTLQEIADELSSRLIKIFERNKAGLRPVTGNNDRLQRDPHFRDYVLF